MKRRIIIITATALIGVAAGSSILMSEPNPGPPGERPELARIGALGVGTLVEDIALRPRARITTLGAVTGNLPVENRSLKVRIWYPASVTGASKRILYSHDLQLPGKPLFKISSQGVAVDGAAVVSGKRFPLILLSHGYGGWSEYSSQLAELLVTKGYVVAAINHNDLPFDGTRSFLISFGSVLMDRAEDQRQVLAAILKRAATDKTGFASVVDAQKIGLIGYSMGGYGALSTAGASYDPKSKTISQLPESAKAVALASDPAMAARIKAVVLLAPWGGQPDSRVWTQQSLAAVKAPVLMISGDHDDVVNFKQGVSWIFDHLSGTERRMLVYREARHNIAGNPVPVDDETDFQTLEFFTEPVWRTERLVRINQHFISAHFDAVLKGDASKAAYLNMPTAKAGDGNWPSKPGDQWGGTFAGADQPQHWRGFQRRWALGLEWHTASKGQLTTLSAR